MSSLQFPYNSLTVLLQFPYNSLTTSSQFPHNSLTIPSQFPYQYFTSQPHVVPSRAPNRNTTIGILVSILFISYHLFTPHYAMAP